MEKSSSEECGFDISDSGDDAGLTFGKSDNQQSLENGAKDSVNLSETLSGQLSVKSTPKKNVALIKDNNQDCTSTPSNQQGLTYTKSSKKETEIIVSDEEKERETPVIQSIGSFQIDRKGNFKTLPFSLKKRYFKRWSYFFYWSYLALSLLFIEPVLASKTFLQRQYYSLKQSLHKLMLWGSFLAICLLVVINVIALKKLIDLYNLKNNSQFKDRVSCFLGVSLFLVVGMAFFFYLHCFLAFTIFATILAALSLAILGFLHDLSKGDAVKEPWGYSNRCDRIISLLLGVLSVLGFSSSHQRLFDLHWLIQWDGGMLLGTGAMLLLLSQLIRILMYYILKRSDNELYKECPVEKYEGLLKSLGLNIEAIKYQPFLLNSLIEKTNQLANQEIKVEKVKILLSKIFPSKAKSNFNVNKNNINGLLEVLSFASQLNNEGLGKVNEDWDTKVGSSNDELNSSKIAEKNSNFIKTFLNTTFSDILKCTEYRYQSPSSYGIL